MPAFILLGWIVGVLLALSVGLFALLAFGLPVATLIAALVGTPLALFAPLLTALAALMPGLAAVIAAALAGLSVLLLALLAVIAILVAYALVYLAGYAIATAAITPLLPGLTGVPGLSFPLASPIATPPGAGAVTVPPTPGEFLARGLMIGFNASVNFLLILLLALIDPVWAPIVAVYAFVLISLAAIVFVARNRVYQGFLGWSAWLFPVSYVATLAGFLLFLFNTIASVLSGAAGFGVALDFTTGVVESTGGFILSLSSFAGGFSLGNFTFLMRVGVPAVFTAPSTSSHETGHSLSTAAFGGVVLWINAIDENVPPFARRNLAYGELLAEGHSRGMPGTPAADYSIRLWR